MKKKMMRHRRNLLRVFTPHLSCFIYKHILTGLHEIKAHDILQRSYILRRADDNEGKYISEKPRELSINKSTRNLALDSGAYDLKERRKNNEHTRKYLYLLSLYPIFFWL
jgi:hypothetical protein